MNIWYSTWVGPAEDKEGTWTNVTCYDGKIYVNGKETEEIK